MSFLEMAKKRHSVRKYEERKVEEEKVLEILEAGRIAPTAANKQPQRILVVQSQEGLEKAAKSAKINYEDKVRNAPVIFIICIDKDQVWTNPINNKKTIDIDASIVTDHMMLASFDLGLGSLWMTFFDDEIIRKEFNVPENLEIVNLLLVGYGNDTPRSADRHSTERKPLPETVFYEKL